jgi:hypothetical protein
MSVSPQIYLGQQPINSGNSKVSEGFQTIDGELFYSIENYNRMAPFFMTITSNTNHWMFISSTGGLTAGRVYSESALFPYYTDDKITENHTNTGPVTILLITEKSRISLWEPFNKEKNQVYQIRSVISKNLYGNRIIFQEINDSLGVSFSYQWMNSRKYGWIRKAEVKNLTDETIKIELVDGLENLLPAGTSSQVQNTFGNLLNAYKRNEVDKESSLGLFTLSATLTDLAEPSESLKANTVWQAGLTADNYLLCSRQLDQFSTGGKIRGERDIKGERGCYFVHSSLVLDPGREKEWFFAADVERDHSQINKLKEELTRRSSDLKSLILEDVRKGQDELSAMLNQNDGLQNTSSTMNCVHHSSNVLFNIMRGGFFYNSYEISLRDLIDYMMKTNRKIALAYREKLESLGEYLSYHTVYQFILDQKDQYLLRIWYEYLPLSFSRRHGDPSRPWNVFSIETEKEDGSAKLDYQGNWRDIFQNWEALCYSYPLFIRHVISKFLNSTTKDGYNPYRISKTGLDWEVPEPGNPWANIGYWSDHQIIYLLKLLEMSRHFDGETLMGGLDAEAYTFANVPYEIKSFNEIVKDPYETINFNYEKHKAIEKLTEETGAEGKFICNKEGDLIQVSLTEKLFILLLAKLGNFIPGGGIWMNTQRPEWNDANNALVGKGISVVTLAYVRRYVSFMLDLYGDSKVQNLTFRRDTALWFQSLSKVFSSYEKDLHKTLSKGDIYTVVESLGLASEKYRSDFYNRDITEDKTLITREEILSFLDCLLHCIDDSLLKNKRDDDLYHSYNTLEIKENCIIVHHLYEMLEGQVAILSSGLLSAEEADKTFRALKNSSMYRADQNSFMLYPNRELPGFMNKNTIDEKKVHSIGLLKKLLTDGNIDLVQKDVRGFYHFNGTFHNVKDVRKALQSLGSYKAYTDLVAAEAKDIEQLFEITFNHQSFTGRSGTFFAYEGLGSIYWHMVSKLLLAAQENLYKAADSEVEENLIEKLKEHYYAIREGIGYHKSALVYGAFPFDPYSHTPYGKGAKQPGMTGQVKEEVLTRLGEMGVRFSRGKITFSSLLVDDRELHRTPVDWSITNASGKNLVLKLPAGSFGGTICQTPFILRKGGDPSIHVHYDKGTSQVIRGAALPEEQSESIFNRKGAITYLEVIV